MTDITVTTHADIPIGSADITVYEDITGDGISDNQATFTATDGTTSATLSGFHAATSNKYTVSLATDSGGPANPVRVNSVKVSVPTIPTAPSNLSATASGDDISLSWADNDATEDGFYVYRATATGTSTADYTQIANLAADTTTYTDANLTDGKAYYYRVSAYNSYGESDLSNEATDTTALPAATNVTLDASIEDEISVDWMKADDNPDGSWEVYRSQDGTLGTATATGILPSTTAYTDTGLTDGVTYHFTVRRVTPDAQADSSQPSATTVLPPGSTVSLDTTVDREITISWTKADDNTSGSWEVYRSQDGTTGTAIATGLIASTTSYTDSALLDGERYYYTLRRVTPDTSADSAQQNAITNLPDVGVPSLDASIEDELTASWTDVINNGDYRVEYKDTDTTVWNAEAVVSELTTSHTILNLTDGRSYDVRVRTETAHATGTWASASAVTFLPKGTGVTLDASIDREISLSWTRNDDNSAGSWEVYQSTDGTLGTAVATGISPTTTSYTATKLNDGEEYYYTVRRVTDTTADSAQPSAVTNLPAPTMLATDVVYADQFDISWTANHNYGNTRVEIKRSSDTTWTNDSGQLSRTTTSYSILGLLNGEKYDIRVIAYTEHTLTVDQ